MSEPVRAAGGIILQGEGSDRSVALVHRPRYDDWSFPKGKLDQDQDEDEASAALREVEEETGLRVVLGPSLGAVTYQDPRGRPKVVRYFQMYADGGTFRPNREVDELRWVPVEQAGRVLSYAHDRHLLRRILAAAPASAVYVIRHAKAGVRSAWDGPDEDRPLTRRGRKQARRLVERFQGLDVDRIVSSPFVRCIQTVEPLAAARAVPVETGDELGEGASVDELVGTIASLGERPTVLCGHGREIEAMIDRLHREGATIEGARGIAKGSVWVLDRAAGRVVSAHYLPAPAG